MNSRSRINSLGSRIGLGDATQDGYDLTTQDAANTLMVDFASGSVTARPNNDVTNFQAAYNRSASSGALIAGAPQISTDGVYGPNTQRALQLVLNNMQNIGPGWQVTSTTAPNPPTGGGSSSGGGGGGGKTSTTTTTTTVASTTSAPLPFWAQALIAAAAAGVLVVGGKAVMDSQHGATVRTHLTRARAAGHRLVGRVASHAGRTRRMLASYER